MTAVRSTVNPLYSTSTQLYAPIVIDEDVDGSQDFNVVPISADPAKEAVDTSISAAHIIENLADAIDHNTVSRFNITRSNVWDGAVRGFRRSTFCEKSDLLVRFTDDAGSVEEGIDAGGPRREFLTLLMSFLQSRPIFEGPPQSRYLVYNAAATREDEYFMAGKMIAVSIVHGGPGPHFLSRDLVNHIAGQPGFCAHVTDVTDDEIGRALSEIELAHSLKSLQDVLLKHSSMLQTAGCFRHVSSVEEKHTVVAEYLTWYTIGRNHSVIERFKDGLASLHLLGALCQHPSVLAPVLCHTDKRLTSVEVQRLFLPQLSPAGSNRRTTETVALSFWAAYLMDCEEQGPVSLEELFMFITVLKTEPPAGMTPHPCVTFSQETIYPMANTCANTITLPLLGTYASFKANMDFGIQNSPGFGCL
ncbi:G2/M phase-specific E3 ubiquitin-protein ligase-like [Trematomus bernacchii]|uniref:G2/M phase-specific E3 ubiquitin-protein ligase-like n=1 Tax=Trematomus bernacchii TaxID=40690 RepID=UPI00146DA989|nr:G2/M phase-specific E3 ubiquitin-protein ligase-like [Trematomus bernacchii]